MVRITTPTQNLSANEVSNRVTPISQALSVSKTENGVIGLYADLSVEGVMLVLAALRARMKVAICSLREPSATLNAWLKEIGVTTLVSSNKGFESDSFIQHLTFDDMLTSVQINNSDVTFSSACSRMVTIMRTSGTTGQPKSAVISLAAHCASAKAVNEYFSYSAQDTWALSLPLNHVSGLSIVVRSVLAKAAIYVAKNQEELRQGLVDKKITHLSVVPTQLKRLLDDGIDLSSVKKIIVGGDALPGKLLARARALGLPLFETYGLTETASMVWVKDSRTQQATVLPHAALKQADDGEILVSGESLFDGYLNQAGETSRTLVDNFFATGDIAIVGTLNQLQLISRKSHRIIAGGENIQAEEIECLLESHPAVLECVVVGVLDDKFGMRPAAFIKWLSKPVSRENLTLYLRAQLSPIKVPKYFFDWPNNSDVGLKKPRAYFSNIALSMAIETSFVKEDKPSKF